MPKKINDGLTKYQRWYLNPKNNAKERAKLRLRKYYKNHPEYNKDRCKEFYDKTVEARREWAKQYYQNVVKPKLKTPEGRAKERMKKARRRALLAKVVCDFTWAEWLELLEQYKNRCAYCRSDDPLEQDHVIPITKKGGHTKSNIVPCCKSCNSSKGNRIL